MPVIKTANREEKTYPKTKSTKNNIIEVFLDTLFNRGKAIIIFLCKYTRFLLLLQNDKRC